MIKRIIAVTAALGMIYGSTLIQPVTEAAEEAVVNGREEIRTAETADRSNRSIRGSLSGDTGADTDTSVTVNDSAGGSESIAEPEFRPIRPKEVTADDAGRTSESDMESAAGGFSDSDQTDSPGGSDSGAASEWSGDNVNNGDNGSGAELISGYAEPDGEADSTGCGEEPDSVEYIGEPVAYDTGEVPVEDGYDYVEYPEEAEPAPEETPEPEYTEASGPQLEYLGTWVSTAYCGCEICCSSYGNATASGETPIEGHTVACNILPFYTKIMVDGVIYTVEDTGWTPYGDEWIDIYFDSHDAALAYGLRNVDVYIVRE